jgi:hypothetical protein
MATLDDDGNMSVQLSIPEYSAKDGTNHVQDQFKKRNILGGFDRKLNMRPRGSIMSQFNHFNGSKFGGSKKDQYATSITGVSPSIGGSLRDPNT